jgi:hypothetical protein
VIVILTYIYVYVYIYNIVQTVNFKYLPVRYHLLVMNVAAFLEVRNRLQQYRVNNLKSTSESNNFAISNSNNENN